jgi:hypothetical protein
MDLNQAAAQSVHHHRTIEPNRKFRPLALSQIETAAEI